MEAVEMQSLNKFIDNAGARWLAIAGMLIAGPSFILNVFAHDGVMPEDVDRTDGIFSLMLVAGVALIVMALIAVRPSPVGRRGRWLLYVEAVMVVLAGAWAVCVTADPANADSTNPFIVIADTCWPLHQAFMLIVGIVAVRAGRWPSPSKFLLFGPVLGLTILGVAFGLGADYLAAAALGGGWVIAGVGVVAVASCETGPVMPPTVATAPSRLPKCNRLVSQRRPFGPFCIVGRATIKGYSPES
jgi:hypothetical protein